MISAVRTTAQCTGYSWASFNSFVQLSSPPHLHIPFQAECLHPRELCQWMPQQGTQHCENMVTDRNRI